MSIGQAGAICDICGSYIFGLFEFDMIYKFSLTGNPKADNLDCCYKCKKKFESGEFTNDFKSLPDGTVRKKIESMIKDGDLEVK